ncbi:hypothetical protein H5410_015024 [Solanum commersonii]|uniref:Uncharacterized protein n=1 Tax=Solanum commersonii TaxID=4109 RepID=A0A9J5ZSN9_SOLCO|nr:hypothetical protein H5410_015024 [Solanum commersonii]
MFLGMMQILYPPIILGTPFINVIYPFTSINGKGFTATYENRNINYTFIIDPISRDINVLINMKQRHVDSLQLELFSINIFDNLKSTKGRGRSNTGGRSSPRSSYRSSSNSLVIQMGRRSLINSKVSQNEASSSVHMEDISENSLLYTQLQAYLSQKQSNIFASIAKEDNDDIKSYEN